MDSAASDDLDYDGHEEQQTEKNLAGLTGLTSLDALEDDQDLNTVDLMSQLKTVTQMFRNARRILENSREFPNHSIVIADREAEKMDDPQPEAEESKQPDISPEI